MHFCMRSGAGFLLHLCRGGGRRPRKILLVHGLAGFVLIVLLLMVKHAVTAGEAANSDPLASMPGGKTVTFGLDIGGMTTDYELQGLAGPFELTESSTLLPWMSPSK